MQRNTKFKPGVSGCPEKQFKPGNRHRWLPGVSGNPAGVPQTRLNFEQAFNTALLTQGSPEEAAMLLWKAARNGEPLGDSKPLPKICAADAEPAAAS